MLVSIVAVVLAAIAFAMVGYPLLRERREQSPEPAMPDEFELAVEDLAAQRDATYSAIKELDFDQEMGNLPEADYRELRDGYRRKAATILRDLDELQAVALQTPRPEAGAEGALEQEIYAEDDIEREIRLRRKERTSAAGVHCACPACDASVRSQQHFCAHCGSPLAGGCPNCGAQHPPEDRFCARCGFSLTGVVVR